MTVLKRKCSSQLPLTRALFYILSPARLRDKTSGCLRDIVARCDKTSRCHAAAGLDMNVARISLKYGPTVLETAGADTER